ncbi:hypothetical protein [Agrobacterium tumefaciens]
MPVNLSGGDGEHGFRAVRGTARNVVPCFAGNLMDDLAIEESLVPGDICRAVTRYV